MFRKSFHWLLSGSLGLASCGIFAQSGSGLSSATDPLDASAVGPPVVYRSSLSSFRGAVDDKPLTWREANDQVGRIGGWRAYAREANAPEPVQAAPPMDGMSSKPDNGRKPMPDPHAGHRMK